MNHSYADPFALSCDSDPPLVSRAPTTIPRLNSILKTQKSFSRLRRIFDREHKPDCSSIETPSPTQLKKDTRYTANPLGRDGQRAACLKDQAGVQHEPSRGTGRLESEHLKENLNSTSGVSSICPRVSLFPWQSTIANPGSQLFADQFIEIIVSRLSPSAVIDHPQVQNDSSGGVLGISVVSSEEEKPDELPRTGNKSWSKNHLDTHGFIPRVRWDGTPSQGQEKQLSTENLTPPPRPANSARVCVDKLPMQPPTVASESFPPVSSFKHGTNGTEPIAGVHTLSDGSSSNLAGFVANVHCTTGREPPPLVGASSTVVGDKLYVFGGRRLSRRRPHMINHLYELDLIRRHWTRLLTQGRVPSARYFHSMCALGDTKLVCYGGMAPTSMSRATPHGSPERPGTSRSEHGTTVMSDIHIYDIPTAKWTPIGTNESPPGRYAHCAAIVPSSAVFTSVEAPKSAIRNNPASSNPNHGSLGVAIDGRGGAEMIIVGGQDSQNRYIEQISVFNLRSLTWTTTAPLGRSCGAYRSVVTTIPGISASQLGQQPRKGTELTQEDIADEQDASSASSILIYSNYNFLDVKLELQVRTSDGSLVEKTTRGTHSPPGLRFPNGGVIDNHFVVSGTFLTSTKQEYALWALNLLNLTWSRVDIGGNTFSTGSWNRGVLWNKRNAFVALGDRKRSLADDYNQRRLNFKNFCVVELEAFGLYENPATDNSSASATTQATLAHSRQESSNDASARLGRLALSLRETADMDLLAIGGERIPVSSVILAQRWGPYFTHLMQSSIVRAETSDGSTLTAQSVKTGFSRNSLVTITPSIQTDVSSASGSTSATLTPANIGSTISSDGSSTLHGTAPPSISSSKVPLSATDPRSSNARQAVLAAPFRSRLLFLPHTHLTLRALTHYLYTGYLPPVSSDLCTPQILCSLLQLARPYHIDGLLEATVSRLHQTLDVRNTPAIFNAAAMAAGGGETVHFEGDYYVPPAASTIRGITPASGGLSRLDAESSEEDSSASSAPSTDTSDAEGAGGALGRESAAGASAMLRPAWTGGWSSVVGLQKRGLRGLLEGRRLRERSTRGDEAGNLQGINGVGLGIG